MISQRRAYVRRLVTTYARRFGIPTPHVRFVFGKKFEACATYDVWRMRHVVEVDHATLCSHPWVLRAIIAHEMGHVAEGHVFRMNVLARFLGCAISIPIYACTLYREHSTIGWIIAEAVSFVAGFLIAPRLLYRGYEVEADLMADKIHSQIVRLRLAWAGTTGPKMGKWHRSVVEEVMRRRSR